jgi:hypothetical protein
MTSAEQQHVAPETSTRPGKEQRQIRLRRGHRAGKPNKLINRARKCTSLRLPVQEVGIVKFRVVLYQVEVG